MASQPTTRNSDEVGILQINPVGKSSITYYVFLVDLPESADLNFTVDQSGYDTSKGLLTISFSYDRGKYPPQGTALKTVCAGIWAWQKDVSGTRVSPRTVEVTGSEDGSSTTSKGGTFTKAKSVSDDILTQNVDKPRPLVIQSASNSADYVVVSMARTVKTNSLLMNYVPDAQDAKKLKGTYNPNDGTFINPNPNVAAVGFYNSKKDQFTTVVIGRNEVKIADSLYNYTSPCVI